MVITTQVMENVTWLPSQALFESGGKTFVYQRTPQGFAPRDVTLVSRSESQAVIAGSKEGDVVAHVESRAAEQTGGRRSKRRHEGPAEMIPLPIAGRGSLAVFCRPHLGRLRLSPIFARRWATCARRRRGPC